MILFALTVLQGSLLIQSSKEEIGLRSGEEPAVANVQTKSPLL